MKTAVEWLVEELLNGKPLMPSLIEQAKEMEKNHLINAWNSANGGDAFFIGLHYYQETFKSE